MNFEVKVPSPGESISEVEIAQWLVEEGEYVEKDQVICEVDSDKATLELVAEESGAISLKAKEGDAVDVGSVIASIDTSVKGMPKKKEVKKEVAKEAAPAPSPVAAVKVAEPAVASHTAGLPSVAAKKIMAENGVVAASINGTGKGGRITKQDVLAHLSGGIDKTSLGGGWSGDRDTSSDKMSSLRRKIAKRLVAVKNETAMLTTFNEVDMKPIMDLRAKYKVKFKEKYGVGLGFMSFFTKACCEGLKEFPSVNAMIDGDHMISHDYVDMGIAVSSPKGLMVPVVRNAESLKMHEIEAEIKRLAIKARDGKISLDEMTGGTFTITNGGVFGSMLSTPIINPPQSAILGMHNIVERPVAIDGRVEVRPVMYVALSYDHRIIDGKESVSFLYRVKEMLEDPARLLLGGKKPEEILLGF
ncbi:MAG: 2-oxoglutarate dehydrogenase complex dihydrolipoyllysine-residue succinyltransferase [Flavobacteriales bacterium]|nr:2-oxoglutarate dehydrogenase complex dihydrolipoyllysine-residue succinyltransferase [Flavobacteriales bacterium]